MPAWPALLLLAAALVSVDLWLRRIGKRRAAALRIAADALRPASPGAKKRRVVRQKGRQEAGVTAAAA